MNNASPKDLRVLGKRFGCSFIGAMLFAVLVFFGCGLVPEHLQGVLLIGATVVLWCECAWVGFRALSILDLLVVAIGLTWGFLFSMSVAISIQNHRDSINWHTMLPGLVFIPVIATVTILPFWYLGRRRHNGAS
jgi:hypothetical protein